jgi:hypothetical protein
MRVEYKSKVIKILNLIKNMIPWLDLPSSYSLDILKKLFKKGMVRINFFNVV